MSVINLEVELRKNETSENLIKRFFKKVKKIKLMNEFKLKQYYKKPSEIEKEKEKNRNRVIQKIQEEKDSGYKKKSAS